jgi:hypothetical protein
MRLSVPFNKRFSALVLAKLGRCPKCMRLLLGGAVTGWLALAIVVRLWPGFQFRNLLALWPASFTALLLVHIVTYGGRSVRWLRRPDLEALLSGFLANQDPTNDSYAK